MFNIGHMNIIIKSATSRPSVKGCVDGWMGQVPPVLLRAILKPLRVRTCYYCRCLLRIPQMLKSIGVAPGDFGIHSLGVMRLTPLSFSNFRVYMVVWDGALSCCNIIFFSPPGNNLRRSFWEMASAFYQHNNEYSLWTSSQKKEVLSWLWNTHQPIPWILEQNNITWWSQVFQWQFFILHIANS